MQKLNTAAQMRLMDQTAMHGQYAIAPAVLMENAGHKWDGCGIRREM